MPAQRPLKVFLVEDDPMQLAVLADYLESSTPHTLFKFTTGEEALQQVHASSPDVVILDYNLNSVNPDASNGLSILQSIKKFSPDTQVIMLSGQDSYSTAMQTLRKGAEQYVVKSDPEVHVKIARLLSDLA
ncbi:MAG: response regulator [Bacteroidota bacterium]|jgi:DNA-binding NarL/FixJ family response regulator